MDESTVFKKLKIGFLIFKKRRRSARKSRAKSQQEKKLKLSQWIELQLSLGEIPAELSWFNKEKRIFRIKWIHGSSSDYTEPTIFRSWAIYGSTLMGQNKKEKSTAALKHSFFCALKSSNDFDILTHLDQKTGGNSVRYFKFTKLINNPPHLLQQPTAYKKPVGRPKKKHQSAPIQPKNPVGRPRKKRTPDVGEIPSTSESSRTPTNSMVSSKCK